MPNVFDQNFSWYKDKPSDDPMRAQKIPAGQQGQTPQAETPRLSWQTASPQNESARRSSIAWVIVLIAVLVAALFLFAH